MEQTDDYIKGEKLEYVHRRLYLGPIQNLHSKPMPYYRHYESGHDPSTISVVMFTTENRASFLVSRKVSGISKNDIPWSRWEDIGKLYLSVKETVAGVKSMNVYGTYKSGRTWSMFKNITSSPAAIRTIVPPEFIDEVNSEAHRLALTYLPESMVLSSPKPVISLEGEEGMPLPVENNAEMYGYITSLAYPMFRTRTLPTYESELSGKSFGAKSLTEMDYTKTLFGKRNYRKDLVKAVAETDSLSKIFFARSFRNHVPVDWIVSFLQKTKDAKNFPQLEKMHLVNLRKLLPLLSLTHRRRLLTELSKPKNMANQELPVARGRNRNRNMLATSYIADTLSFISRVNQDAISELNFSGWKELHDLIVELENTQRYGNAKIPETPLSKKIAALPTTDEIVIILPEDTKELRFWGRSMNHCIGSYSYDAASGRNVFIGILKNGEMIGNAQLDPSSQRCIQILGKHNAHLPAEDLSKISSLFEQHAILPKSAFKDALGVR